jgi:hypothetical protein
MKAIGIVGLVVLTTLALLVGGVGCSSTEATPGDSQVIEVAGVVVGGGDTTPADGPMDAPRKFVFEIERHDGTRVNVSYTAYPPSPAGDAARAKITLDFSGGSVNAGDSMEARGTLDKGANTVVVAEQGDYIRTFATSR